MGTIIRGLYLFFAELSGCECGRKVPREAELWDFGREAYTQLAVNVIKTIRSLDILAFVDDHEEVGVSVLPSWVPDWHTLDLTTSIRCPTHAAAETNSIFSIKDFEKRIIMKCGVSVMNGIRTISGMIPSSELTVMTLECETKKKNPFLINTSGRTSWWILEYHLNPQRNFFDSLSLVLTGGYLNDADSTCGEGRSSSARILRL